jgi:hypothetical protein
MFNYLEIAQKATLTEDAKRVSIGFTNGQTSFHYKHYTCDRFSRTQNYLVWLVGPCKQIDDYLVDE